MSEQLTDDAPHAEGLAVRTGESMRVKGIVAGTRRVPATLGPMAYGAAIVRLAA
jgi:hypothetical protein